MGEAAGQTSCSISILQPEQIPPFSTNQLKCISAELLQVKNFGSCQGLLANTPPLPPSSTEKIQPPAPNNSLGTKGVSWKLCSPSPASGPCWKVAAQCYRVVPGLRFWPTAGMWRMQQNNKQSLLLQSRYLIKHTLPQHRSKNKSPTQLLWFTPVWGERVKIPHWCTEWGLSADCVGACRALFSKGKKFAPLTVCIPVGSLYPSFSRGVYLITPR